MEKSFFRKAFLDIRNSLSPTEKSSLSQKIKQNLFCLKEFELANSILFYASERSEVETLPMVEESLAKKRCFLPKVFRDELKVFEIKSLSELSPGYYGILEPNAETETELEGIELIIVPGLVFSKDGGRIGYGKGFYDRLLAKTGSIKIGLCFSCQLTEELPRNEHDQRVDRIITEDGVIYCSIE
ncbi:MAG: 5-formyltetrahydrofolate cyclo-ligase [bacterium]|nr:5-formyltetrahydrofolate cyclo-ligase [bacterium]